MEKNNRKKSSYYVLTNEEKLDLKSQKCKMITNTSVAAIGILTIAATCLASNTALTEAMTISDFLLIMFGGSASIVGTFGRILSGIEYGNLEYDIYSRAEREGRTRK